MRVLHEVLRLPLASRRGGAAVDLVGEVERLLLEAHAVARLVAIRRASVCSSLLSQRARPSNQKCHEPVNGRDGRRIPVSLRRSAGRGPAKRFGRRHTWTDTRSSRQTTRRSARSSAGSGTASSWSTASCAERRAAGVRVRRRRQPGHQDDALEGDDRVLARGARPRRRRDPDRHLLQARGAGGGRRHGGRVLPDETAIAAEEERATGPRGDLVGRRTARSRRVARHDRRRPVPGRGAVGRARPASASSSRKPAFARRSTSASRLVRSSSHVSVTRPMRSAFAASRPS